MNRRGDNTLIMIQIISNCKFLFTYCLTHLFLIFFHGSKITLPYKLPRITKISRTCEDINDIICATKLNC